MADLFISYNRSDRDIVERLAERFGRYGVEIWFDARLEQGDPFDIAIQTQLRQAKAVLVAWTPTRLSPNGCARRPRTVASAASCSQPLSRAARRCLRSTCFRRPICANGPETITIPSG